MSDTYGGVNMGGDLPREVPPTVPGEGCDMGGVDEKLDELDEKIAKLETKKRRLQAEAKRRYRKEQTRRKILLGSMLLEAMEHSQWRDRIRPMMERYLEREIDRKLFTKEWWERRYPE